MLPKKASPPSTRQSRPAQSAEGDIAKTDIMIFKFICQVFPVTVTQPDRLTHYKFTVRVLYPPDSSDLPIKGDYMRPYFCRANCKWGQIQF